ncbi:4-alpha-glucanotransferase [Paenarthrobacter sp. Z7-10]|uniref:4-alpha-glucanotransferase n=1 Tax=Paenarthrobacter sp. Z7-10 TaxID=2787635 RepID=UPI0022A9CC3E|nr:4-alpha-glucanotransferase [Paenarthrobacter sp. Z7-10]MCZ2404226.1 4-alpha-glucanotransferase [Paenarthrobacter sp. Z7-10]
MVYSHRHDGGPTSDGGDSGIEADGGSGGDNDSRGGSEIDSEASRDSGDVVLLRRLADTHGVATAFHGWDGGERQVSTATLRRVLTALGVEAQIGADLHRALRDAELEPWRRMLPAVVVLRQGQRRSVPVHVRHGDPVQMWITAEDGSRHEAEQQEIWVEPQDVDGVRTGCATFALPTDLPLGWHQLHAESEGSYAHCSVVVTPRRLAVAALPEGERGWGLMAQLYSVRSARSWGIGDFADLADLASVSGAQYGADFTLVNPLHAAQPIPPVEPSPYLPSSRRFFHPLYLRVEDIAEYGYLDAGPRALVQELAERMHAANLEPDRLDRDSAYAAKLQALALIYAVRRSPGRNQNYAAFRTAQGRSLEEFALWCALAEKLPAGAPEWKAEAAHPDTEYVRQQRGLLADRIDFHCWLQWLCDQQLAAAQDAATSSGMRIGVVHDLAVGVQSSGADAWLLQDVLAPGISVGAPPDMFNQQGQNWMQPPWHPDRLAAAGYAPYRNMLRNILRHAGGIRVDHVLGLFRLWWIPEGGGPQEGTYVNYDHEALIGILALEAQRANAVVIGEDLGTFEPWVREYLAERGILGTSILWFEHQDGRPLAPEEYRRQCLTSVNTHDLPPTAGYLAGEHLDLRESLGLLERPVAQERAEDFAAQERVLALLRERGLLPEAGHGGPVDDDGGEAAVVGQRTDTVQRTDTGKGTGTVQRTVEALYAFVAQTPSVLVGLALVDAVGEHRIQNQPGTQDEYLNWRIPLAGPDGRVVLVDDLPANARLAALAEVVAGGIAS